MSIYYNVKNYKRVVATGMGLCVMLLCGALNALIMNYSDWLSELSRPDFSPAVHSLIWLIDYLFTAIIFGEFFIKKNLRKYLFIPTAIQILNAIWCLVFFRLHNVFIPLFVMIILLICHFVMVCICVKNTGIFTIFPSLLLFWYAFLLGTNIVIAVLN